MKKLFIICISLLLYSFITAQESWENVNLNEQITLLRTTGFNDAVRAIEQLSQKHEGKKIVNLSTYSGPIGVPIKQMHWKEALQLILDFRSLALIELPGAYQITDPDLIEASGGDQISPETRQVRISGIFLKINESFSKDVGINWSTLVNGEVQATINFRGANNVAGDIFSAAATERLETGNYIIDVNTLLKLIESNQEGAILARPNLIVLSGRKGFIQVGEDFSIKTIDEDGNTIDRFFETGIIMEITPTIIQQGDNEAIHMEARVEKSTAIPGVITTIITKSTSETEVLLYDGEETVIGGLYDTDEKVSREGIPFLKDLPWWVFGIRYLTGSNRVEKTSGEMIIILKVEIVKPIDERRQHQRTYMEEIDQIRDENKNIHDQLMPENLKK